MSSGSSRLRTLVWGQQHGRVRAIGAADTPGVPSLLTVEHTATGLWSASRGIPLFVAILVGYVIVLLWTRWRNRDRTAQQRNHLTHSRSD